MQNYGGTGKRPFGKPENIKVELQDVGALVTLVMRMGVAETASGSCSVSAFDGRDAEEYGFCCRSVDLHCESLQCLIWRRRRHEL